MFILDMRKYNAIICLITLNYDFSYYNNDACESDNGGLIRTFIDPSNLCTYNSYFNLTFIDVSNSTSKF